MSPGAFFMHHEKKLVASVIPKPEAEESPSASILKRGFLATLGLTLDYSIRKVHTARKRLRLHILLSENRRII